jgi:hypothetical protein
MSVVSSLIFKCDISVLGNPVSEDVFSQEKTDDEVDGVATAEHIKLLIEDCKKMLISDTDVILGAWGLTDADPVYVC